MAVTRQILIIGAMKCGTTSLYDYLAQHPDIASSAEKEPKFFSSDERFARGRAWYEALYPDAGHRSWIVDGSTDCAKYPYCGDVPARLDEFGGSFKLVYIMRHPLRRIESHARHAQLFGAEINDIRSDRSDHGLDTGVSDISMAVSDYAVQIDVFRRWHDQGDMILLTSEELRRDPVAVVGRVLAFVGLRPLETLTPPAFENRSDERLELRAWAGLLKRNPAIGRAARALVPERLRRRAWRTLETSGRFGLTPEEESSLVERLTPSLIRLRDEYGIDAQHHWGIALPG